MQHARGRRLLKKLLGDADIFVYSLKPAEAARWKLDFRSLKKSHPSLIPVSVTPFGLSGPYRNYEATPIVLDALSGMMSCRGHAGRPPVKAAGVAVEVPAAYMAFLAAISTLRLRGISGEVRAAEVSMLETLMSCLETHLAYYAFPGLGTRQGFDERAVILGPVAAADGHVVPYFYGSAAWQLFTAFIGRPELEEDPRFATPGARIRNAKELRREVGDFFRQRGKVEAFKEGQTWRLPFGYVGTIEESISNEQLVARQFFRRLRVERDGEIAFPGPPWSSPSEKKQSLAWAAPGQSNGDVYGSLGVTAGQLADLADEGVV